MPALTSRDPANGQALGEVAETSPGAVAGVVAGVAQVQPIWAELRLEDRGRYLQRAAQVIVDELEELQELLVREQGRPRAEAHVMELVPAIELLRWAAVAGERILAPDRVRLGPRAFFPGTRARVAYEPLGVVGVITASTSPLLTPIAEAGIALMAGNGVVLKPSPLLPLLGARVQRLFERAGLPEGIVATVQGGRDTARALVDSGVAKVLFTGSEAAGRDVAERCAGMLKGSVLELGGKDPMLVLADANVPRAVAGALWGAFSAAGQRSARVERIYVEEPAAERFLAGLVGGARRLAVGDPGAWDTQIGPLLTPQRADRAAELVEEAVAGGATLHCGGPVTVAGLGGRFFAPAVLGDVPDDARILQEELLAPVVCVARVGSVEEAIARANDSRLGLGASVWTADRPRGQRIAGALEAGMVWLNDHASTRALGATPWGGVKDSGLGRLHGRAGFMELVEPKLTSWDPPTGRQLWWFPYDRALGRAAGAAARLHSVREPDRKHALRQAGAVARVAGRSLRALGRR